MDKQSLIHKTHIIAENTGLPFNTVLTHFFLEVVLLRIAASEASKHFIFKGGLLLSNILGIENRTTIDIDLLITGIDMTVETIRALIDEALKQQITSEVSCMIQSIEPIRDNDPYGGFRVRILCKMDNIRQVVPLDIAVGDPITPGIVKYLYYTLFPENPILLASYNIETILAEKVETVYRRGLANSRCKDFYDIHIIWKWKQGLIDYDLLEEAFRKTCAHRLTKTDINGFKDLLELLENDIQMVRRWDAYIKRSSYVRNVKFSDTLNTLFEIMPVLFK